MRHEAVERRLVSQTETDRAFVEPVDDLEKMDRSARRALRDSLANRMPIYFHEGRVRELREAGNGDTLALGVEQVQAQRVGGTARLNATGYPPRVQDAITAWPEDPTIAAHSELIKLNRDILQTKALERLRQYELMRQAAHMQTSVLKIGGK